MSTNVHWLLLRPGRFLFFSLYVSFLLVCVATTSRLGASGASLTALQWWGMLFPMAVGMTLASMLHEPMHRPFGLLLPGARRRFFGSHVIAVSLVALGCALVGHFVDRTLPVAGLAGIAAAALSFALPFEPDFRWSGSRALAGAGLAGAVVAIRCAGEIKGFLLGQPWLGGGVALAIAVINFAAAFSTHERRRRALTPFTSHLSSFLDPELMALCVKERTARGAPSRRHWRLWPAGGSLRVWLKAMRYERSGRDAPASLIFGWWCAVGLILYAGLKDKAATGFAAAIYSLVELPPAPASRFHDFPFLMTLLTLSLGLWAPRAGWLYPVSRTRRAQVTFAVSAWQSTLLFVLVTGTVLLSAWIASQWLALPFRVQSAVQFTLSLAVVLPLLPLIQWCLLHGEVRRDRTLPLLCGLLSIAPLFLWRTFGGWLATHLVSPGGVAVCVLLIGASQFAYYAALRRFYRKGDLIQRGTTRLNLSLV